MYSGGYGDSDRYSGGYGDSDRYSGPHATTENGRNPEISDKRVLRIPAVSVIAGIIKLVIFRHFRQF